MSLPTPRPLRWVSWAAVSSEEQAVKISLEQQAADNLAAIERHAGQLVATLTVPGHTRYYALLEEAAADMPAYHELRDLVRRRAFDVLAFRDITRLGRTAALCMAVLEVCRQAGIALYATADPPATLEVRTSHSDMLIHAIHSVGAQEEVHRLRERNKMGMIGRVRSGKLPGAAPFGYRITYGAHGERQVVIDEPAAAIVRTIIDLYLAGMGTPRIADRLRDMGLPSITGVEWAHASVVNVLENGMRYAGYAELNKDSPSGRPYVCVRGDWEPIISEETLERLLAERAQRKVSHKLADTVHRFSSVCICDTCGNVMPSHSPSRRLRCARHIPNNNIPMSRVVAALESTFATLDVVHLPADVDADESAPHRAHLAALESDLERIHQATLRADDMHIDGDLDDERYRRQLKRLAGQKRAIEIELERAGQLLAAAHERGTRRQRLETVATVGLAMLNHDDPTAANVWLRRHVRVHVAAGEVIEIEFL